MKTVKEVATLAGISVRALHYYDEIGLLPPTKISETNYRYYDENALSRLQQILFFRELDFPLSEIRSILDNPSFDTHTALKQHRDLLSLKRKRLDRLIQLVDETLKGETTVSFQEFDKTELEEAQKRYAEEARERWGGTDAYKKSVSWTKDYKTEDWARISTQQEQIFQSFAAKLDCPPGSPEVQKLVAEWQDFISANFYPCTDEILAGLGELYRCDDRFRHHIDQSGEGVAQLMSEAIRVYTAKA